MDDKLFPNLMEVIFKRLESMSKEELDAELDKYVDDPLTDIFENAEKGE